MIQNKPLISVLICTFNAEFFIKKTIQSILYQTYQNIEILIYDNNSKDNTVKIINELQEKHKNIKLFVSKDNIGPYQGINYLMNHAQGKYIAINDHDDINAPDRIETQVSFLENQPTYIGCSVGYINFYPKQKYGIVFSKNHDSDNIPHNTLMFRKGTYRYDSTIYMGDMFFIKEVLAKHGKLACLGKIGQIHLMHENNLSKIIKYNTQSIKRFYQIHKSKKELLLHILNPIIQCIIKIYGTKKFHKQIFKKNFMSYEKLYHEHQKMFDLYMEESDIYSNNKKKKIAIDISHYNRLSGYGIVTNNIVDKLIKNNNQDREYYLISNKEIAIDNLLQHKNVKQIIVKKNYVWYKFFGMPKILKELKIDTFFSLDQTLPIRKVCRYVVIEHDIGFQRMGKGKIIKELFRKKSNKGLLLYYLFGRIEGRGLKKADSIICPSGFTKKDIIQYYHIDHNKIHTVYRGIDHIKHDTKEHSQKKQYILFPFCNDNVGFTYSLATELIKKNIIPEIIFLKGKAIKSDSTSIHSIQKYISNEEKEKYYKEAVLTIYYSEYDGFGFIPLESMIHQTPVIINKSSSLQEISGDAAITIERDTIKEWTEKIKDILSDKKKYQDLIHRGIQLTEKYTREHTIDQITKLL